MLTYAYLISGSSHSKEEDGMIINGVVLEGSFYPQNTVVTVGAYTAASGKETPALDRVVAQYMAHYSQYFKPLTKEQFEELVKANANNANKATSIEPSTDKPKGK
jgi:hypothetical protein